MSRRTAFASAIAMLALMAGLVALLESRSSAQGLRLSPGSWPPDPRNLVQLRGAMDQIAPQASAALYTVPAGKWLVVTDLCLPAGWVQTDWSSGAGFNAQPCYFSLSEHPLAGADQERLGPGFLEWVDSAGSSIRYQSVTGLVFGPGSELRLVNVLPPLKASGSPNPSLGVTWNLSGYLTP